MVITSEHPNFLHAGAPPYTAGALFIIFAPAPQTNWVRHWGQISFVVSFNNFFFSPSQTVMTIMTACSNGRDFPESSNQQRVRLLTSMISVIWVKLSAYDICWLHENPTGRFFFFPQNLLSEYEYLNVEWRHSARVLDRRHHISYLHRIWYLHVVLIFLSFIALYIFSSLVQLL